MKCELLCDKCGLRGTTEEITTDSYDDRDMCIKCRRENDLMNLRQQYENKKKWLEDTHLRQLNALADKIRILESAVSD